MAEQEPASLPGAAGPRHLRDLFVTFTTLALQGFGGVLAVAQRVLCEQKGWLSNAEFVEMLSTAQILPGPNVCNLSLFIGQRFFGWRGAFAALAGMTAVPLLIVLLLAALFTHAADHAAVAGALRALGAVAAGMIAGTTLKLAASLKDNPMGRAVTWALGVGAFMSIIALHLRLLVVLLALGPLAYGWAWRCLAVQDAGRVDSERGGS
jgi:chromate transporter